MLLRVSSERQLESDGDLSVQRSILKDYINKHTDWVLDEAEYFEGSKSAYKNTAVNRDVLQEILHDAKNRKFDILVPYKDDRVGRLMWDTAQYVMELKKCGVDIYTVKDGCISPEPDDIMGQMMLTFRYANAQKSSADTGMRVKDTAQKLVEMGKFMGGCAPYGYRLEYSGEISKHGRALKHLVVVQEQAEIVKKIYELSLYKELGSVKIAKILNEDKKVKNLAPNDVWKASTITSILTNPIYSGHTAYKRRESVNGKYHRLDSKDWIISSNVNKNILIIDKDLWDAVQEKRRKRSRKFEKKESIVITNEEKKRGDQALSCVMYCGYCGGRMVNAKRYSYWSVKSTNEKKVKHIPIYKCSNALQGILHDKTIQYRADKIDEAVFGILAEYIERMFGSRGILEFLRVKQVKEREFLIREIAKEKQKLTKMIQKIEIMEKIIPDAMSGEYPLSLEEVASIIHSEKKYLDEQKITIAKQEISLKNISLEENWLSDVINKIPKWDKILVDADIALKRNLVEKMIERITVKKDRLVIRFKINVNRNIE